MKAKLDVVEGPEAATRFDALQLLRAGVEAEHQKKQRLEEMLRQYRECADPRGAERLSDELGAMIFGQCS